MTPVRYAEQLPPSATRLGSAALSPARRPWRPHWVLQGPIAVWPQQSTSGTLTDLVRTPAGTVDLRTGEQRTHQPGDYITKLTAVAPGGTCPAFLRFLAEVTDEDADLRFLTAAVRIRAHRLHSGAWAFFLTAWARMVKRVSLHGRRHHGRLSPLGTDRDVHRFHQSTGIRPTSPACAAPASSPPSRPRRAAAGPRARIKTLTGGDQISARFMRQDFFDFTPQFKLVIAGNHKPGLRSVDEAIRRRFHLVPFTVTIPPDERDLKLGEKLKARMARHPRSG